MDARPEQRTKLWDARDNARSRLHVAAAASMIATDVCVPLSRLADMRCRHPARHRGQQADRADRRPCRRRQFPPDAAGDRDDPAEVANARRSASAWSSGPGDGRHLHRRARRRQGQDEILLAEHGAPALEAMRSIKQAFDPLGS